MQTTIIENKPDIWLKDFPVLTNDMHKYDRGHAVIFGAPELSGATRLAASACSRIGTGLVTVLAASMSDVYRTALPADIMVREEASEALRGITTLLGGPGGICPAHKTMLLENAPGGSRVFDAGAIPEEMDWHYFDTNCVLTPHEGEFRVLFPWLEGDKVQSALKAAQISAAVIILKGPQTIIAHPDGRLVLNNRSNPYLAKAGTGDVLAGFLTGLLAQGMQTFEAGCAAVWIHSQAGDILGPGLTSCDLEYAIPEILRDLDIG